MIIRAIDFETTGIPTESDKHAIVEIGWCDQDEGGLFSPVSVLCNPGRPIPPEAMSVHHITDAMVAGATGDLSVLGKPDYFAAHNAEYEQQFFTTDIPVICTWKSALRIWPDAPSHGLQFLRYFVPIAADADRAFPPHRAAPDAYVCAELVNLILTQKLASLDEMVRWSSGPGLLPRCPLTKHRGQQWKDVPTDYLNFIVNKSTGLDRHVIATAKYWLKQRETA